MTQLIDTRAPSGPGSGFQSSTAWQPLVLTTLLPFHVGTGGLPAIDPAATARTGFTIVREEPVDEALQTPAPVATSDRVLLIRRWLSLSVAEAARALGVQRPTVYAWERGEVPAQKNADRLRALFELANHWRSLSDEPVGALRKEVVTTDAKSLVALLCERRLRHDAIRSTMTSLCSMQKQELAARPLSGAELAQRFGFRPLTPSSTARNVAREAKGRPGRRGDKA
ncbi:MAG TPA: helix-turn-helix domain-containing protein [Labilithrix sp.]|jgi:DNA-binding transcriptional regulator YiaG|nr:helix-turn-helix domain-containing protein [Labilithrix sp.]